MLNQNPEQLARDEIDRQLLASGWVVQSKTKINLAAATGVAVREYQTNVGPLHWCVSHAPEPKAAQQSCFN